MPLARLPADAYRNAQPQTLPLSLRARTNTMKKNVGNFLDAARKRYRHHFDEQVRIVPMFEWEQYVYVIKLPLIGLASGAGKATLASYNKITSHIPFPRRIFSVTDDIMTSSKEGIQNIINIDRAVRATGL